MKKNIFKLFMFAALLCAAAIGAAEIKPKYIFLFIGDGMSIPQRLAAEEFSKSAYGRGLAINAMKYQALTTTSSANSFITDSAASGTAIACGAKTNNGMIGVTPDGKMLESVATAAKARGRKVGIVTSVTINHATPASFYAHNKSRGNYYQIALEMLTSGFDYFGGGGIAKNDNKKDKKYRGDIYKLAAEAGYFVSRRGEKFKEVNPGMEKVMSFGADNELPFAINAEKNALLLADFVKQAISQLENGEKGFFIMAEGGKIDWCGHGNDAGSMLREMVNFDNAVKVAMEFAKKHPAETLIVVTGDHETGGLTLGFAGTGYMSFISRMAHQKGNAHAFRKKLERIEKSGRMSFEAAKKLASENFGFVFTNKKAGPNTMEITSAELATLRKAYDNQYDNGKRKRNSKGTKVMDFENACIRLLANKSALAWTSGAHTALPVSTTSEGVGAEKFTNTIDNTDIAKKLKTLL